MLSPPGGKNKHQGRGVKHPPLLKSTKRGGGKNQPTLCTKVVVVVVVVGKTIVYREGGENFLTQS